MSILLVSKIRSLREALLTCLLANGYDKSVVATGVDGKPWRQVAHTPSVLFVSCDATEGVQLVSEFRVDHPSTSIGVLPFTDRDEEFIAWAGSGISGYVEPDTALDGIVGAILRLAEGKIVYPPRLSGLLLHRFGRRPCRTDPQDGLADLTRRELEIVEMLADGQANKHIARRLMISEATVKNHVHNILEKLNVGSRGQAAARFRRSQFGFAPVKYEMALPALDPAAAFKACR